MKVLRFIHLTLAQRFYAWAEAEISKTHPDLPGIVLKRHALADEARRLFA